ncbi:MAG: S8 family serine peptidase [Candidatus Peribacteraceae bacterium]|nr:S8 family serine peptidase [Candidatus Peribacteraceae bacterium]
MHTHTTHPLLQWTIMALVAVCATQMTVSAGRTLTAAAVQTGTAASSRITPVKRVTEQEDIRIRTCAEAGTCEQGKKRVIMESKKSKDLIFALQQKCRIKKWIHEGVTMECPDTALVPSSRIDRVFRTQDIFVNDRITATAVQTGGYRGNGVTVAILDTGIDANHPEFSGRIAAQASFIAEGTMSDVIGHGTHVAGIVAGRGAQQITDPKGINRALGSAPEVNLLIGKVCNDQGYCMEGDIAAGIEWAVYQGAKVINLSLGGGAFPNHCDSDPLAAKANWAASQGVTVVAASGNGAEANPGVATPACGSQVIAVGALDWNDVRPVWSGNGNALDVMSTGLEVLSSLPCAVAGSCPAAGYGWWSGTSMAAPSVTGVAALLLNIDPTLAPQDVRSALTQTAWDLGGSGFDTSYGYGRVNTSAAAQWILDRDHDGVPVPQDCDDSSPAIRPGALEQCNGTDDNCDGTIDEGCAASSSSVSSVSSASSVSSVSSSASSSSSAPSSSSASSTSISSSVSSTISSSLSSSSQHWSSSSRSSTSSGPSEECLSAQQAYQSERQEYDHLLTSAADRCNDDAEEKFKKLTGELKDNCIRSCGRPCAPDPLPPPQCSSAGNDENRCSDFSWETQWWLTCKKADNANATRVSASSQWEAFDPRCLERFCECFEQNTFTTLTNREWYKRALCDPKQWRQHSSQPGNTSNSRERDR